MGDEIGDKGQVAPEVPETPQDPIKSFLEQQDIKNLVDAAIREPTKEEAEVRRVKDIEARLIEMVKDQDLLRFLEAYHKATGKLGEVKLFATNPTDDNPMTIGLDSDGIIIYYPKSGRSNTSSKFQVLREVLEYKQADPGGRRFKAEDGEVEKTFGTHSPYDKFLTDEALFSTSYAGEGCFMVEILSGKTNQGIPFKEYDPVVKAYKVATKKGLELNTLLGLQAMANEMRGIAPHINLSSTLTSTPLTNPTS